MYKQVTIVIALLLFATPYHLVEGQPVGELSQQGDIINITVAETWDMLNAEQGPQHVIDDRTFSEYFNERIDTPHRNDKPILFPLQLLEQPLFLNIFTVIFQNKDIIIYCRSANRSYIGAKLLIDDGFQGTIYNMAGGINAWKAEGLPTVKGFGFGS
jgi:rhodanese-related sulfurtransferase